MDKILKSPLRPEIDKLLLDGKAIYEVEKWCGDNKLKVSAASIKRYAEVHLPDWQGNKKIVQVESAKSDDETKSVHIGVDLPEIMSSKQLNKIISEGLKRAIAGLVTVVDVKIADYTVGESALPKEDIASLEKLVGIFDKITGKHNEDRAGNNIFDIDEALEKSEKVVSSPEANLHDFLNNLGKSQSDQ